MRVFKLIPGITLMMIVAFVNYHNKDNYVWYFVYYLQMYIVGFAFIILGLILDKSTLAQSLLITLGLYFLFEMTMDIIRIFDSELWDKWHEEKTINYLLSIAMALSLYIIPIIKRKR
jgi:hypothetical protein